jgi:hypothetical protein
MPAAVEQVDIAPNFGAAGGVENGFPGGPHHHLPAAAGAPTEHFVNGIVQGTTEAAEDELNFSVSLDKVQDVTEQIAEFLVNFSSSEQRSILAPFLESGSTIDDVELREAVAAVTEADIVEPHIDEARRFIWNYLAIYSECERDLILGNWRPAIDNASTASATESLTPSRLSITPPSLTPPGSATPTAVTPREFLNARRHNSEVSPRHSTTFTEDGLRLSPG